MVGNIKQEIRYYRGTDWENAEAVRRIVHVLNFQIRRAPREV